MTIRRRADGPSSRRIHDLLIAIGLGLIPVSLPEPAAGATALVSVPAATPGLATLGLALDCGVVEAGDRLVFAAGALDLAALAAAGAAVDILVPDLEEHYARRSLAERALWEEAPRGGGFGFGSMGGYYTWSEVIGQAGRDAGRLSEPGDAPGSRSASRTRGAICGW